MVSKLPAEEKKSLSLAVVTAMQLRCPDEQYFLDQGLKSTLCENTLLPCW